MPQFDFGVLGSFGLAGPNLRCQDLALVCQSRIQDVGAGFGVPGPNLGCPGLALGCQGPIWDVGTLHLGCRDRLRDVWSGSGGLWHVRAGFGVSGGSLGRI